MKTHGESRTLFYYKYRSMKKRCEVKTNKDYARYGGRGIKCLWKTYEAFKKDMYPSYLIHVALHGVINTSLERINNNKSYSKKNCMWIQMQKQALNRRTSKFLTVNGVTKNYSEWARIVGCSRQALRYRVIKGLHPDLILKMPFKHSNKYAKAI